MRLGAHQVSVHALLALLAGGTAIGLSTPPMRALIEQSMVWHMAVQMPLLFAAGWFAMGAVSTARPLVELGKWNRYGLTGFIAVQAIVAYWMLPLAVDQAVVIPLADLTKITTILLGGTMIKHSFDRAPQVLQLFFIGYTVSMFAWLGLYFATTDLRLCNSYSSESQTNAGWAIAMLGVAIGLTWAITIGMHLFGLQRRQSGLV